MIRRVLPIALAAQLVAAVPAAAGGAEALSPLEQRGAEIYHTGKSAAERPVFAIVGMSDARLPGSALPCAGCHGPDGLGRPEGGIAPVPITWDHLTKPYGHRHASGRKHPAFTEASLRQAIAQGIDPAGNRLDPSMPRFDMAAEDLDALVAYLKALGSGEAPGIADATITLGMLVPGDGQLAPAGEAAAALVEAYLKDINAKAGVYGRRFVLETERLPGDPAGAAAALDRLIDAPVFALLGAVPPSLQAAITEQAEAAAVPMVHLWPPPAEASLDSLQYSFYLMAGLRQETEQLVRFAEEGLALDRPKLALAVSPSHRNGPTADVVTSRWADAAIVTPPASTAEAGRLASRLQGEGTEVLFALAGRERLATLLEAAAGIDWFPTVLAPGSLAGEALRNLPPGFEGRAFLAYPMTPADRDPDRLARLAALRAEISGGSSHGFSEAAAYGAVSLLVEALRLAGRDISRGALIAAVEGLYGFRTGVVPPLTFGPNRRIGAAEPRIVRAQ